MSQQPDQQQNGQFSQQQSQSQSGQQARISFQAIHQHARNLLRQYTLEKEAAGKAGLNTPEGEAHMLKAERIKALLVSYSRKQKLLQQQQQQNQAQAQPQAQAQAQAQLQGIAQPQQQAQQQAPITSQVESSPMPVPEVSFNNASNGMMNINSAASSQLPTPQPQDGRSLSQQNLANSLGNNNNNGNTVNNNGSSSNNGGTNSSQNMKYDAVILSPAQQLQLKKQQLLNKYQKIMTLSEQFKKNMALIQKRLSEPNIDDTTKANLLEKEQEVRTRLEYCKRCTLEIATQLKVAQQQAQQLQQQNRAQSSSSQIQQIQQSQPGIPNTSLNGSQSMGNTPQVSTPATLNSGASFFNNENNSVTDEISNSNMKLNAVAGNTATGSAASSGSGKGSKGDVSSPAAAKKAAAKKQNNKGDNKRTASTADDGANKKQKVAAAGNGANLQNGDSATPTGSKLGKFGAQPPTSASSSIADGERAKFQNLNIPDDLKIRTQDPVSVKVNNRPSLLGGNAISAPALSNPVMVKPEQFQIEGERVLNKRKLKELVASVANEEGETEINIDGDVEELLLDLADEFVTSVTSFASKLARHRHSENLDVRDVQLHLERNWNIRIPGYAADEIRMIRKFVPNSVHNSKLNGVFINKSVDKAS